MPQQIYTYGLDALTALKARLNRSDNLFELDKVIRKYEGDTKNIYVRKGRGKVVDRYPSIGLELLMEDDPFAASDYTRDIIVQVNVLCMLKVPGGDTHPASEDLEDYIAEISETVKSLLNQREQLKYVNVNTRGDHIWDSGTAQIEYGYLHSGALRVSQQVWHGKFFRAFTDGGINTLPIIR